MSWRYPVKDFFNQPQVSEVFKKLPWSHGKGISQRNLAMKVLEPIPLQTAGFVQACQHLLDLDLFTCRSQMLLSVQSPTEAVRCTFPKHSLSKPQGFIDRRHHYHCWTTGIYSRIPSSAGGRKEKPGPSLSSSDTLLWCLRTYLLTIQLNEMWPT